MSVKQGSTALLVYNLVFLVLLFFFTTCVSPLGLEILALKRHQWIEVFFTPRGFSLGTPVFPQNANAIGKIILLSCNKSELPFFPIFGGVPTFARDISKNDCTCYAEVIDEKSSSGGATIKNMSLFVSILYLLKYILSILT